MRDPAVHIEVIKNVVDEARTLGFVPLGLNFSPIRGPEGNIEYLFYLGKQGTDTLTADTIQTVVAKSHAALEK